MKSEIPQDVVDFQPDAIQIRDEKLPLWARFSIWSLFGLFALAIVWSCLARVDVIVQAGGKLVSDKQTLVIKPIETSIIEKVNVQVGDIVNEGDILITFDPTINKAEVDRLNREIRVLSAQIARLGAEFDNRDYRPSAQDGEAGTMQKSIFDQRRKYYDERIVYYNSALQQLDASKKSREDNLAKQKERLVVVRKMEQMYSDLHEKNAASLKDTWNIQITRMEMESTVDQLQNSLLELVHQRESTAASRNSFIQEWRNSISEEKVKLERELDIISSDCACNSSLLCCFFNALMALRISVLDVILENFCKNTQNKLYFCRKFLYYEKITFCTRITGCFVYGLQEETGHSGKFYHRIKWPFYPE